MMTSSYSLLYDVIKPANDFDPSTTFDQNSPPELLHDSEEDDGDSLSSAQHDFFPHHHHSDHNNNSSSNNNDDRQRRKSIPHRSPSMIQEVYLPNNQGTLGTSFVFQWDSSKVNHGGGSLLSALRSKVALARQQQHSIKKKRAIHHPRRQLTATCIALPTHHDHQYSITQRRVAVPKAEVPSSIPSLSPPPRSPPPAMPSPPRTIATPSDNKTSQTTTTAPVRHTSSGRPSRVKGPCQACNETSDGCMRKAFDWPFPASQIFNDKGRPFVYLCNKCGLRYNKSRGSVCRHCRWVFCKEEKRKAMQYIDKMRRNRSGQVDLDDDIEGFVCSPKYWSCGRPWKVRWVLNDHPKVDEDE